MPPVANKTPLLLRLVGYAMLATAPLWFAGAGYLLNEASEKQATWLEAEARVVELVERESGSGKRGSVTYSTRFTFTACDGRTYTVTSGTGSNPPAYELGEALAVLYPEADPAEAVENTFMGLYFVPLMLALMGLVDVLVALTMLWHARRQQRAVG